MLAALKESDYPGRWWVMLPDELMRMPAILFLAMALVVQTALAGSKPQRVVVDPQAPREEIRKELLEHTPADSSTRYVVGFLSNRLAIPGDVSDIRVQPARAVFGARVRKTIRIYLGQYYRHLGAVYLTAPMVMHEDVSALWLFDGKDRLIDIIVDKQARVY